MVKIKVVIIIGFICFILGAGTTGFTVYKITSVSLSKLDTENKRISELNKQITGQLKEAKDTITRLNESNDNFAKYIKQLEDTIGRITKSGKEFGNTIDDNDRIIQQLADINKYLADELKKLNNSK
jgi:septal ring factor EnvC (AmiA/AmiB activator)